MASSSPRPPRRTEKTRAAKPAAPVAPGFSPASAARKGGATSPARRSTDVPGRVTGTLALRPALNLLPYQRRWVEDHSPLKIVAKARQIGYSFAATLRAVLRQFTWEFGLLGDQSQARHSSF
jgi:hypothetical protein